MDEYNNHVGAEFGAKYDDLSPDDLADELYTLEAVGVQSLNTAYTDVNKNLGNGNTLAQEGSYTKTDGTTAQMGTCKKFCVNTINPISYKAGKDEEYEHSNGN